MKNIIFNVILMLLLTNIGANAVTPVVNDDRLKCNPVENVKLEKNNNYENLLLEFERQKQINYEKEQERIRKEEQKRRDIECYYDPNNVTVPSGISVERIYELLEGTTFQTWDIANLYYEAEHTEPKINALFNIAIARQESGHGKSPIATGKNNITSIRLGSGNYKDFESKYECINETNRLLKNSYLVPNGDWFTGYSSYDVGYHYYGLFDGENWSGKINSMVYYIIDKYPHNNDYNI